MESAEIGDAEDARLADGGRHYKRARAREHAYEIVGRAREVAAGEIEDQSLLPILFKTLAGAHWRDEALW